MYAKSGVLCHRPFLNPDHSFQGYSLPSRGRGRPASGQKTADSKKLLKSPRLSVRANPCPTNPNLKS